MSQSPSTEGFSHEAVMTDEVVAVFSPLPRGVVVDATVGGGGHARALLDAHADLRLVGIDRDDAALAAAADALRRFEDRVTFRLDRFDHLQAIVQELADEPVVGVLFDLGVSSAQLDQPDRGFSHRADAPLDMRMDRRQPRTAADLVNEEPVEELARILRHYGDERYAFRIARAIAAARPVRTTGELVDLITSAIPAPARRTGGHPARRSFQALRIAVNEELDVLRPALDQALDVLAPGGRCAVLAYHSGEDRIVKDTFVTASTGGCTCPPALPCACGAQPVVRLLWRGARKPSADEIARNPRARSARLRAVEKLPAAATAPGDGEEAA